MNRRRPIDAVVGCDAWLVLVIPPTVIASVVLVYGWIRLIYG
ncbi:hypothetical protein [Paenibacillus lycopersici]|nr:hypothetical protein [Paenibacillus lycopersici]